MIFTPHNGQRIYSDDTDAYEWELNADGTTVFPGSTAGIPTISQGTGSGSPFWKLTSTPHVAGVRSTFQFGPADTDPFSSLLAIEVGNNLATEYISGTGLSYYIGNTKEFAAAAAFTGSAPGLWVNLAGSTNTFWAAGVNSTAYVDVGDGSGTEVHAAQFGLNSVATDTLSGGTFSATVKAGSHCVCTDNTDTTHLTGCSLSGTTLTETATGATDMVTHVCL